MSVLKVLGIDTSGKNASVAVTEDGKLLAQYFVRTNKTHSQVILPLCRKMLEDLGIELNDIDRFAVAAGPGSYTGLRIGISAVKALSFALDRQCNGISTLEAIAYNFAGTFDGYICTVMKARLDIVYCAVFRMNGQKPEYCMADCMMTLGELADKLAEFDSKIIAAGDAAEELIKKTQQNNIFLAPAHLREQLASGICMSASDKEGQTPDKTEAFYMQITKAEKDLQEKNTGSC
jgi:tRNA threonylcarbamoyladenosine biosynthesis protein TsaB